MNTLQPLEATQEEFRRSGMVARAVELMDIRQPAGSYRITPSVETKGRRSPLQISSSAEYEEKSKTLKIAIRVNFLHQLDKKDDALEVEAEYHLEYHLTVPPPPKVDQPLFFGAFMKLNATLNYWPYFREYVQNVSSRSGLPKVVLPVLRLPIPKAESKKGSTKQTVAPVKQARRK